MHKLITKIPARREVLAVFSTAIFVTFSWSIYRMFYQVPSWLFYFSMGDILWILAYVVGFALLEGAFLLGFMILLTLLFPEKLFKTKFVAQSILILLILTVGALLYQKNIGMLKWWGWLELLIFFLAFVSSITILVLLQSFLLTRFPKVMRLLEALAERLTVFALIYFPLGVIGLSIIIVRNLFSF